MKVRLYRLLTLPAVVSFLSLCFLSFAASADSGHQNHFASILLDGKKIGTVHYSVMHNERGELEQVKTKASISVFGIKLYDFSHQLHEEWSAGELQSMWGHSNDSGTIDEITLQRDPAQYSATRNDEPLTLPHESFPLSLWHYEVVHRSLLFDVTNLRQLNVEVAKHEHTLAWGGKIVQAERADFTGDWQGSVWYDRSKRFLKAEYMSDGRNIVVVMDSP